MDHFFFAFLKGAEVVGVLIDTYHCQIEDVTRFVNQHSEFKDHPRLHELIGILHVNLENWDQARDCFQKASEQDSKTARVRLGRLLFQKRQDEEAQKQAKAIFEHAIEEQSGVVFPYLALALIADDTEHNYPMALRYCQEALEMQKQQRETFSHQLQMMMSQEEIVLYVKSANKFMGTILGLMAYTYHLLQEPIQVIKYLELGAQCEDPKSIVSLADEYMYGHHGPRDEPKAIALWKKLIEIGDPHAMERLATMYAEANDVTLRNYQEVERLYQQAIDLGNKEAVFNLGLFYSYGESRNPEFQLNQPNLMTNEETFQRLQKLSQPKYLKAIELFEKAEHLGFTQAWSELAEMYHRGNGVPHDLPKAMELYQKAIDHGETRAMLRMAEIYKMEKTKDLADLSDQMRYEKCLHLYQMAHEKGDHYGTFELAKFYAPQHFDIFYEIGRLEKNLPKALELYELALKRMPSLKTLMPETLLNHLRTRIQKHEYQQGLIEENHRLIEENRRLTEENHKLTEGLYH